MKEYLNRFANEASNNIIYKIEDEFFNLLHVIVLEKGETFSCVLLDHWLPTSCSRSLGDRECSVELREPNFLIFIYLSLFSYFWILSYFGLVFDTKNIYFYFQKQNIFIGNIFFLQSNLLHLNLWNLNQMFQFNKFKSVFNTLISNYFFFNYIRNVLTRVLVARAVGQGSSFLSHKLYYLILYTTVG